MGSASCRSNAGSPTPLYILEFANPDNAGRLRLPLKVKVLRREANDDDNPDPSAMEDFKIEEIQDADSGNHPSRLLTLRLQTIREQDGYWRDTGRLSDMLTGLTAGKS